MGDLMEVFAGLPSPEEILALRPSAAYSEHVSTLLDKNKAQGLSKNEQEEWEQLMRVGHLVRIAKAKTLAKLKR